MSRAFLPGDSWGTLFSTVNAVGASTNADSTPTATMYRNGTADGAVTITIANPSTGLYRASCTIPGTYTAGDRVQVHVSATIGGITTNAVIENIRLIGYNSTVANLAATVEQWRGTQPNVLQNGRVDAYAGVVADKSGYDLVGSALNAIRSGLALSTETAAIKTKTDNLPASPASEETVLSRLAAANYIAPDNAGIAGIKTKTDTLPTTPADEATVLSRLAAASYVAPNNSGIAAIITDLAALLGMQLALGQFRPVNDGTRTTTTCTPIGSTAWAANELIGRFLLFRSPFAQVRRITANTSGGLITWSPALPAAPALDADILVLMPLPANTTQIDFTDVTCPSPVNFSNLAVNAFDGSSRTAGTLVFAVGVSPAPTTTAAPLDGRSSFPAISLVGQYVVFNDPYGAAFNAVRRITADAGGVVTWSPALPAAPTVGSYLKIMPVLPSDVSTLGGQSVTATETTNLTTLASNAATAASNTTTLLARIGTAALTAADTLFGWLAAGFVRTAGKPPAWPTAFDPATDATQAIAENLAAAGTGSTATNVSPISPDGRTVQIVRGDAYRAVDGTARTLRWKVAGLSLVGATNPTIRFVRGTTVVTASAQIEDAGGANQAIRADLSATVTAQLVADRGHRVYVDVVLASGSPVTLVNAAVEVVAQARNGA